MHRVQNYKISIHCSPKKKIQAKIRQLYRRLHGKGKRNSEKNFFTLKSNTFSYSFFFSGHINATRIRNFSDIRVCVNHCIKRLLKNYSFLFYVRIDNLTVSGSFLSASEKREEKSFLNLSQFCQAIKTDKRIESVRYINGLFTNACIRLPIGEGTFNLSKYGNFSLVGVKSRDQAVKSVQTMKDIIDDWLSDPRLDGGKDHYRVCFSHLPDSVIIPEVCEMIADACENHHVHKSIRVAAQRLSAKIRTIGRRKHAELAATAIYLACNDEKETMTVRDVASMFQLSTSKLYRCIINACEDEVIAETTPYTVGGRIIAALPFELSRAMRQTIIEEASSLSPKFHCSARTMLCCVLHYHMGRGHIPLSLIHI